MVTVINNTESAIARGIREVGIGKKGSRPLTPEHIQEILAELKSGTVPAVVKGAFFGSLVMKGITAEEKMLDQAFAPGTLQNIEQLVESIAFDAPHFAKQCCIHLLKNEELDFKTSKKMGQFLFSTLAGDGARGIVASVLRVRYETPDEYAGLLQAMEETIEPGFRQIPLISGISIQIAEPFDGVDHSNMITPLLAQHLQTLNYHAFSLVGRNSGPKFFFNLLDIAQGLNAPFLCRGTESCAPTFGCFINQQDISKPIDHWVDLRRQIIKRPFLATLERFINPVNADILIASAFHPPYGEKMLTIAERAGFPAAIIVRNGIEGTIAFPLKRSVKMLCSAKQTDGTYLRHEIEFNAEEYLKVTIAVEEKLEQPSLAENIRLIETYNREGKTNNELLDYRVKATCAGIKMAIEWIEKNKAQQKGETNES